MSKRLVRGTLAVAFAVVLLSGTGATTASWSDAIEIPGATVTSGHLALEQDAMTVSVQRTSSDGTVHELPGDIEVVPGDVVRLTSTVTVRARGDVLRALLVVDPSAVGLSHGGIDFPVAVPTVTTDLHDAGNGAWTVTAADDGTTVTATVDLTIPRTTDGRQPAADRSNWWGRRLQGVTLDPGTLRWTLTQETA